MKNNYCILKRKLVYILGALLFSAIAQGFFTDLSAQVVINHPVPNGATSDYTTTWTVPANVSSVTIEAWGGGAGASYWNSPALDKGGQGGGYAEVDNLPVTQGEVLNISIGAGGQAGSYCGGNTTVNAGINLLLRAEGGAFFFVNCVCYDYYVYPGTACTNDTAVNQQEAGQATNTTTGGNAGGMTYGGGAGGISPGGNGTVPGGGAASGSTGSYEGASGRVKISYVLTGIPSVETAAPFYIYPNPAAGIYHLSFNTQSKTPNQIIVCDLLGNIVYERSSENTPVLDIDISSNAKGFYFVKVISEGNTYLSRLAYL